MCGSGVIASMVVGSGCRVIVNDISLAVIDKIGFAAGDKFNLDYRSLVDDFNYDGSVFYFDPPYLFSSRSGKKRLYQYEWNDQDHADFIAFVKAIKQPVLISHFSCDTYDSALKDWRVIRYNTMTRAGVRSEALYMNFPQPTILQCYKSAGGNFTDRQRIKRKVDRLIKRLDRESPVDRACILSAVFGSYPH